MRFPPITPPEGRIRPPAGSEHLGRLAEVAGWLAACQGQWPPTSPSRARLVLFAAEHGAAEPEVTGTAETTAGRVLAVADGGDPLHRLAELGAASIRVVEVGGGKPSGRIDREDALTEEQAAAAVDAGRAVADAEVDGGADLLLGGELGVGADIAAIVLVAAITGVEPVAVVGLGAETSVVYDDRRWASSVAVVRDALRRARPVLDDPIALLRVAGGADLAALAGFLAQAAARRTPVLLDGVAVGAAALLAERLAPGARRWWLAAHRAAQPAHTLALDRLERRPLLDLGLWIGGGTGSLATLPLLRMAAELHQSVGQPAAMSDVAGDTG